ncbi:hypothetical protein [Streptomyces zagrosensis]|uniref:Uncharacterized protein n=1 Tax=Streptomyces zagrosensis TaxID=1042984 RepID=A0A7W9QAZ2_9ACTN|nr:hypothetical protein [Streptomyces zagrosensis]MBB5936911.1 hypothetical protein [Streptomyces zagrosensis]
MTAVTVVDIVTAVTVVDTVTVAAVARRRRVRVCHRASVRFGFGTR